MTAPDVEAVARGRSCDQHTQCPEGYIQWHAWAERMSETHTQHRCDQCGLYAIWEPKPAHITQESNR